MKLASHDFKTINRSRGRGHLYMAALLERVLNPWLNNTCAKSFQSTTSSMKRPTLLDTALLFHLHSLAIYFCKFYSLHI